MQRVAACLLAVWWVAAPALPAASAEPASEGRPHKWVTVEKSLIDFLGEGFELKAVVYDTSEIGAKPAVPDVHYFLQKSIELVRCDFRKRDETSYYWCAQLTRPN
jgi:hypothetical protein